MTRVQDIMVACLLVGVMILAFCGAPGCAAAPPPAPKWSDRVDVTSAVYVRGEGGAWACSGVAVEVDVVLTAAHCMNKGAFTVIAFPGVEFPAELIDVTPGFDLARVRVQGNLTSIARISPSYPAEGAVVFKVGFGCYGTIAVDPGLYIGVAPDGDHAFAMGSCRGDSGGPIFDSEGRVFALVSSRAVDTPAVFAAGLL